MTEQDVVLRQQELLKVMEELEREVRSFHADVQARTALWADVERFGGAFGAASQLLSCEHELTLIARQLDRLRGGSAGRSGGREADAGSGRSSGDEEVEMASASAELGRMLEWLREVQPEWAGRIQEAWDSIVAHDSAQRAVNWERRTIDVLARILAPLDRQRISDARRKPPEAL